FDSKASADLVSHAGVAVLEVVALGIASTPHFMQVARKTARCANQHIAWSRNLVHNPDDFSLADRMAPVEIVQPVDLFFPGVTKLRYASRIGGAYGCARQGAG